MTKVICNIATQCDGIIQLARASDSEDALGLRVVGLSSILVERLASTRWRSAPALLFDTISRLFVRTCEFVVFPICFLRAEGQAAVNCTLGRYN